MTRRFITFAVAAIIIFVLDNPVVAEFVAENSSQWDGKPLEGDGECVTLVKKAAKISIATKDWKPGKKVKDASLVEGTAIATFENGQYTNHAAIYLGQDKDGIQVIDQWAERKNPDGTIKRKAQPPHKRTIRWDGKANSDNGTLFFVIESK